MEIRIGLIGSGFMGRAHALGFAHATRVFDLPLTVVLDTLADIDAVTAAKAAHQFGFEHSTGHWEDLLSNAAINLIDITSPNALHKPMAMAAIAAGKHVYCEKPLAPSAADCLEMTLAAEKAGVKTAVGFNYIKNPMMALAREIIQSGEIGDIRSFRGIHAEDYMADANTPWTWRLAPGTGGGALGDIGSHIIATARYLLGEIASVQGFQVTAISQRPDIKNAALFASAREASNVAQKAVEVDDISRAFVTFANGASGSIEANWIATGRKMQHDFEIYGSKGALLFTQERFNELHLFVNDANRSRQGFKKIFAGPEHTPYGDFCVAGGHQIGFNDLKTIEIRDYLLAIVGQPSDCADFREGYQVQRTVEAIAESARSGKIIAL